MIAPVGGKARIASGNLPICICHSIEAAPCFRRPDETRRPNDRLGFVARRSCPCFCMERGKCSGCCCINGDTCGAFAFRYGAYHLSNRRQCCWVLLFCRSPSLSAQRLDATCLVSMPHGRESERSLISTHSR